MTCIIAIETATEACSAALLIEQDGKQSLYKRYQLAPREHTKLILPMLDEVLSEAGMSLADADAIAFGRGPGAFTGLRIATGIAQGLALSVDKPTIAISSLMTMALAAQKEVGFDQDLDQSQDLSIIAAIDARMGEVYWAEYEIREGDLILVGEEQISKPDVLFERTKAVSDASAKPVVLTGSAWDVYLEDFKDTGANLASIQHIKDQFPAAEEVSQLALLAFNDGEFQEIEDAQPVYLRNNVAEKSKKKA